MCAVLELPVPVPVPVPGGDGGGGDAGGDAGGAAGGDAGDGDASCTGDAKAAMAASVMQRLLALPATPPPLL